jgi:hypothetical protein
VNLGRKSDVHFPTRQVEVDPTKILMAVHPVLALHNWCIQPFVDTSRPARDQPLLATRPSHRHPFVVVAVSTMKLAIFATLLTSASAFSVGKVCFDRIIAWREARQAHKRHQMQDL